jgi:hypothetical protein
VIPVNQWLAITKANTISNINDYNFEGLKYFLDSFVQNMFMLGIPDNLLEEANNWRTEYFELMEYVDDLNYRNHRYPNPAQAKF